jgi:hypothetical protein
MAVIAASCGDTKPDGEPKQNESQNDEKDDSAEFENADDKSRYNPNFEAVDMGGYEFKVGTRNDDGTYHGGAAAHTRDIIAEAENGDLINDVVYRRNTAIEEKYNIKITMDSYSENDELATNKIVEKSVKAGDKSYDLHMSHMIYATDTAAKGCYLDLARFPNIDLTKPYWNKGANDGCSIANRLYFGLSDFSFSTNENLYCIFFNKQFAKDYNLEDPYKLVREKQWTMDKFSEIIKVGTIDLNGDGKWDENDQYGYISTAAVNFLWSCGGQMMAKDEDDMPYLDFINERVLNIYAKTFDIVNSEYSYNKEMWWFTGPTIGGITMFANAQGVFYGNQLCRVNELRAVEFDFGIIPYPKYDVAQERYYSYVDGHASMMAIPMILPNPDWTSMIVEELSYLSYKDILPTYYDVVLNVKMVRDEESVEMLKILFDSKVFDPAYIMTGGFTSIWAENISQKKTDFVSTYEKQEKTILGSIQKKIDAILAVE